MVCALGCQDQLVGRSHECDYPLFVKKLPVCTEPNFEVSGTSREIECAQALPVHVAPACDGEGEKKSQRGYDPTKLTALRI